MKKILIRGIVLIIIIFTLSGVFILYRLDSLASVEKVRDRHEKIYNQYQMILLNMERAQAELYRHQAGYTRNINNVVENVLEIEDMMALLETEYEHYLHDELCNSCHDAQIKFDELQARLEKAADHLNNYENRVSFFITVRNEEISNSLEKEALRDGEEVLDVIGDGLRATTIMTGQMVELQSAALRSGRISIVITIFLSAAIALVVVVLTIIEMRNPLLKLVEGIKKVSSGRYDSKVDLVSDDEIGYLAKTFNTMTDNLNAVTREKDRLLEELRQLNDNLEERVRKAVEELDLTHKQMLRNETLSAVGVFASGVAHELATPLSSLVSYVQMMKKKTAAYGQYSTEMELVEKELLRCRNILRGMLAFSRAPEKEQTPTDLNGVLQDLLTLVQYQARNKNVLIQKHLSPSLPFVMAITGQLRQVFMNIIMNALQSMPDGGELEVETFAKGNRVGVKITDTGCGIPEEDMERIFQPFYTSKETGTGLGLSISYGIVKAHGGDIEVISEEGKGTTFYVYLPVAAEVRKEQVRMSQP
jgi:two-component system NtrC family sensor kinase